MSFIDEVRNELNRKQDILTDEQKKDIHEIANAVKISIKEKAKSKDLTTKNGKKSIAGSISLHCTSDDYYYICSLPGENYIDETNYNGIVAVQPYERDKDIYIKIDSKFIYVLNETKRLLEKENIVFHWELSCRCERVTGIIFLKTIRETFVAKNKSCLSIPKEYIHDFFTDHGKKYKGNNCFSSLYGRIHLNFNYEYNI